jgi:hypothetical protein
MPIVDFPNNPDPGDTYSFGPRTWEWDGVAWKLINAAGDPATIGEMRWFAGDPGGYEFEDYPNQKWLRCDGSSHLQADYPELYAVLAAAPRETAIPTYWEYYQTFDGIDAAYYVANNGELLLMWDEWGTEYDRYATSPDGVNWTVRTGPGLTDYPIFCETNDVFFVGNETDGLFYSTDGINWTLTDFDRDSKVWNYLQIEYWNGYYYLLSTSADVISRSSNLDNWTNYNVVDGTKMTSVHKVVYFPSTTYFIAIVSYDGSLRSFRSSNMGETFTAVSTAALPAALPIGFVGSVFYANGEILHLAFQDNAGNWYEKTITGGGSISVSFRLGQNAIATPHAIMSTTNTAGVALGYGSMKTYIDHNKQQQQIYTFNTENFAQAAIFWNGQVNMKSFKGEYFWAGEDYDSATSTLNGTALFRTGPVDTSDPATEFAVPYQRGSFDLQSNLGHLYIRAK